MENIFDSKYDRNLSYTGDTNLPRYSSGNRWQDMALDFGSAIASANPYNRPVTYFVDSTYAGNGLARTSRSGGIDSAENKAYKNPLAMSEFLKSRLRQDKYGYNQDSNIANRLSNLFGTKILGDIGTNNFIEQRYPSSIYDDVFSGDTIYDYNEPRLNFGYLNGGNYADFGKTVSDYLGSNFYN